MTRQWQVSVCPAGSLGGCAVCFGQALLQRSAVTSRLLIGITHILLLAELKIRTRAAVFGAGSIDQIPMQLIQIMLIAAGEEKGCARQRYRADEAYFIPWVCRSR